MPAYKKSIFATDNYFEFAYKILASLISSYYGTGIIAEQKLFI